MNQLNPLDRLEALETNIALLAEIHTIDVQAIQNDIMALRAGLGANTGFDVVGMQMLGGLPGLRQPSGSAGGALAYPAPPVAASVAAAASGGGVLNAARLIDCIQSDSTVITNTTTETVFDRALTIPGGTLTVGRSLSVKFGFRIPSGNSTDTLQLIVRMDGVSGTAIFTGSAVDVGNSGDFAYIELLITRRPDSSGLARCVVQGKQMVSTTGKASGLAETSIDWTTQRVINVTATWSVASASNQVVLAGGTAVLE